MREEIKPHQEEERQLRRLTIWSWYMKGARAMYRALERSSYLDYQKKSDWIVSKAQLKLYMENTRNLDWFLHGEPSNVQVYTEFERDKKGKVIGAKAKFVKKETKYKEI